MKLFFCAKVQRRRLFLTVLLLVVVSILLPLRWAYPAVPETRKETADLRHSLCSLSFHTLGAFLNRTGGREDWSWKSSVLWAQTTDSGNQEGSDSDSGGDSGNADSRHLDDNSRALSRNHTDNFCGYLDKLPDKFYVAHPPTADFQGPTLKEKVGATSSKLLRDWVTRFSSYKGWPSYNVKGSQERLFRRRPRPLFPTNADQLMRNRALLCGGPDNVSAVVGFAVGIEDQLAVFLRSFQKYAGLCTALHIFVANASAAMLYFVPEEENVVFESYQAYTARIDAAHDPSCHRIESQRVPILQKWLLAHLELYGTVLHTDTKDVVFMSEPFDVLKKSFQEADVARQVDGRMGDKNKSQFQELEGSGFVFALWEEYAVEKKAHFPFNFLWTEGIAGTKFAHLLESRVRFNGFHQFLFGIGSGIYGGTALALVDFLELFTVTLLRVQVDDFGFDQGAMNVVVHLGLELTRFPHYFFVMNPNIGPYRHMYNIFGGFHHIRFGAGMAHFNCNDEPYAIVHQLNRNVQLWKQLVHKYKNYTNDFCAWQQNKNIPHLRENVRKRQSAVFTELNSEWLQGAMANASFDPLTERGCVRRLSNVTWGPHCQGIGEKCRRRAVLSWIGVDPVTAAHTYQPLIQSFLEFSNQERCPSTLHLIGAPPRHLVYNRQANSLHGTRRVRFHPKLAKWAEDSATNHSGSFFQHIAAFQKWLHREGIIYDSITVINGENAVWMNVPHPESLFAEIEKTRHSYLFGVRAPSWYGDDNKAATDAILSLFQKDEGKRAAFRFLAAHRQVAPQNGMPFPVISAQIYGGTPCALSDLFAATLAMEKSRHSPLIIPRGVIPALLVFGLVSANFSYPIVILDDAFGPYRVMYRDGNEAIHHLRGEIESGIHVNCQQEPYSLVLAVGDGKGPTWHYATHKYLVQVFNETVSEGSRARSSRERRYSAHKIKERLQIWYRKRPFKVLKLVGLVALMFVAFTVRWS